MGDSAAELQPQVLLKQSLELVTRPEAELAAQLFGEFFKRHPEVEPLFSPHSNAVRSQMVRETLKMVTDVWDEPSWLETYLLELGQRHAGWEVTREMFTWFEDCLLDTLAKIAGAEWKPAYDKAWREALRRISSRMEAGFPA